MKSNAALLLFIASYCLLSSPGLASGCKLQQIHLSLGSSTVGQSNQNCEEIFRVGVVAKECDNSMPVQMTILSQKSEKSILIPVATKIQPYRVKAYTSPDQLYQRRALFFSICKQNLTDPSLTYFYTLDSSVQTKGPYQIPKRATSNPSDQMVKIFAIADLSSEDAEGFATYNHMANNLKPDDYDMIIHSGDFAYSVHSKGGQRGDDFFHGLDDTLASVPYMVTPGNHEVKDQGKWFDYRFDMPKKPSLHNSIRNSNYYAYRYKNVYFASLNWDYFIDLQPNEQSLNTLITWLKTELETQNFEGIEWKIFYAHRPIYCSKTPFEADCMVNNFYFKPVEDLLLKYGFDLYLSGHKHIYDRMWPVKNFNFQETLSCRKNRLFQIINGHAGVKGFQTHVKEKWTLPWDAQIVTGGGTFLELQITKGSFVGYLKDSATLQVMDTFKLDRAGIDKECDESKDLNTSSIQEEVSSLEIQQNEIQENSQNPNQKQEKSKAKKNKNQKNKKTEVSEEWVMQALSNLFVASLMILGLSFAYFFYQSRRSQGLLLHRLNEQKGNVSEMHIQTSTSQLAIVNSISDVDESIRPLGA